MTPEEPAEASPVDPANLEDEQNPLNPVGDSLDQLIQMRLNDDLWSAMQGDLPCLTATEACIRELQDQAIANSPALQAIDERVALANEKIDEARARNQRTINLGIFEPAVTAFFQIESLAAIPATTVNGVTTPAQPARRRGFLERIMMAFDSPLRAANDILALVGLPLFRNISGGDAATQQREIAISDLQVKIAEIENKRGELANAIREQVMLQVLDFDQIRREFQIAQEVGRRATLRLQILEQNYRFAVGGMDTPRYLTELSNLDQQKAQTFRAWARLRSQLVRVKLLVLGSDSQ